MLNPPGLIPNESRVQVKRWPTEVKAFYDSKGHYEEILAGHVRKMSYRQNLLYAGNHYAVLIIFQAMDAAGKDGVIKHVMPGLNPQGCQMFSFKHPSALELKHDFLWRITHYLPEHGHIGIFNRSYYEEMLITRVHPEIVVAQNIPGGNSDAEFWKHRYPSINDLENHLHRYGPRVVKFFLHLSKKEQRRHFLARIDDPCKNWKFSQADIAERQLWDKPHDRV